MSRNIRSVGIVLLLLSMLFLPCCKKGRGEPIDPWLSGHSPIFQHTIKINVLSPYLDTLTTSTPSIFWEPTGQPIVMAAIFNDNNINVSNNNITNWNRAVWAWHSGMGTGREGNLLFLDGKRVVNGDIDYNNPPLALDTNNYYYLAVWAWDDKGISIKYSSPQIYFAIK